VSQTFTMIFACEPGGGGATSGDVGHCWVAVEFPKGRWTVRGFYPDPDAFAGGVVGAKGLIQDDHNRFSSDRHRLRTRTQRGLTEKQVRGALTYMFRHGASYRSQKAPAARPGRQSMHADAHSTRSTRGWSLWGQQCAWFAVEACKAAGFNATPYNTARLPWECHSALGGAGDIDARNLPRPFGPGPA
jgi:hypothetical protein